MERFFKYGGRLFSQSGIYFPERCSIFCYLKYHSLIRFPGDISVLFCSYAFNRIRQSRFYGLLAYSKPGNQVRSQGSKLKDIPTDIYPVSKPQQSVVRLVGESDTML